MRTKCSICYSKQKVRSGEVFLLDKVKFRFGITLRIFLKLPTGFVDVYDYLQIKA